MDYTHYTAQQFAQDRDFQDWVLHANQESQLFWETWLVENPHKRTEVEQARAILLGWQFEEPTVSKEEIARLRQKVMRQTATESTSQPQEPIRLWSYARVAASVTIALAFFVSLYWWMHPTQDWITYRTNYGEVKTFMLPDSSEVTLNANSNLRFLSNWEASESRVVWLKGEAYFKVTKQVLSLPTSASPVETPLRKFLVNANELEVAVVGTQFNVYARSTKTEVVLEEGIVTVGLDSISSQIGEPLRMQPGEKVTYEQQQLYQQTVDPSNYTSWRKRLLKFDKIPLNQVAQIIEETYGVTINFASPDLAKQLFTGTVPSSNLDILLEALTGIYQLQVVQKDNQLIFSKNSPTK